jgi:hypothetical protein
MTSQDCLVHWSGPIPRSSNTRLVDETAVLPYQKGSTLYDTNASTEDINNQDHPDRQNHRNNGHQDRKRGPDNTIVVTDKSKKFSKFKKFEDIKNMHCIWHHQGNHITEDCRIFLDRYTRKGNNGDKKEDNQKKDENNPGDKEFQQSKGTVAVIFARILGSRSKH